MTIVHSRRITHIPTGVITLRQAREQRGWSQVKLESVSRISDSTISRIENGGDGKPTTYAAADALADALGVPRSSIYWPCGLTEYNSERVGLKYKNRTDPVDEYCKKNPCPTCFIELPIQGECQYC